MDPAMRTDPRRRKDRKGERGSSLVEGVFVLLTLMAMIIFILDMGRILLLQQFITERVRVTARQAAVNNWDSATVANYLVFGSTTAPTGQSTVGFMGLDTSRVSYQKLGTVGSPTERVQVSVSGVPATVYIPMMAGTYTLPPIVATAPTQSLGATN